MALTNVLDMSTTRATEYNFDQLADEYRDYTDLGWDFTFTKVVEDNTWAYGEPTQAQFDQFVAEIESGLRCVHCGHIYEPMASTEHRGSVCENCGGER